MPAFLASMFHSIGCNVKSHLIIRLCPEARGYIDILGKQATACTGLGQTMNVQVTQMQYRLSEGNGECYYYLGKLKWRHLWLYTMHATIAFDQELRPSEMIISIA